MYASFIVFQLNFADQLIFRLFTTKKKKEPKYSKLSIRWLRFSQTKQTKTGWRTLETMAAYESKGLTNVRKPH